MLIVFPLGDAPSDPGLLPFVLSGVAAGVATLTGWIGGELVDRLAVGVDNGAHLECARLSSRSS
jgi:hypothetical protein